MNKRFDRYAGVIFLAIGAFFVSESMRISSNPTISKVGPSTMPMMLGILLLILSVRLIYETFRYPEGRSKEKQKLHYGRFAVIFGAAVLYALLIEKLGYVITTFLFLVISFQMMQRGRWLVSILIAGLFSLGVYYGFVKALHGFLPGFPEWLDLF